MAIKFDYENVAFDMSGNIKINVLVFDDVTNKQSGLETNYASGTSVAVVNADIQAKAAIIGSLITEET